MSKYIEKAKELINSNFGKIKILEFNRSENGRLYFNTLCNNCSRESIRRLDQVKNNLQYCKYCKDSNKKSSINSVINSIYATYKNSAKIKNLEFTLDKIRFTELIEENCYYCGSRPIETPVSKLRNRTKEVYLHNGVDRIDSNKGYIKENIVSCCSICNYMKKNFNLDTFYNQIKKIYKLRLKKEEDE